MKKVVLIILVLVPVFCFAQSKKDLKSNKIKSETVTRTEQKDGVKITYKESYEEYDKNGRTIQKVEYSKSGDIKTKETFKYDAFGNVIEKTEYAKKDGKNMSMKYKYDANGQKIEEQEFDSEGNLMQKRVHTYNGKGLKTESRELNPQGEARWVKTISYTRFE